MRSIVPKGYVSCLNYEKIRNEVFFAAPALLMDGRWIERIRMAAPGPGCLQETSKGEGAMVYGIIYIQKK
jgi:hypothetical protein